MLSPPPSLPPSLQMCFLKSRITDKHKEDHQVMEFSSASKGHSSWHSRLLGSHGKVKGGRVWREVKSPFVYSPRTSVARYRDPPMQCDA